MPAVKYGFAPTDGEFKGATVTFPNLNDPTQTAAQADELQTNLIMPEPTIFLNKNFPNVSIVRPTQTRGAAMGAVRGLTAARALLREGSANGAGDEREHDVFWASRYPPGARGAAASRG